jgi:hypothetical protein
MRAIKFNTHDEDVAVDTVAIMLLGLQWGGRKYNHITFDSAPGGVYTGAWRYADGTWAVGYWPKGDDTRRRYDNPVEAARAIVGGHHDDEDVTAAVLAGAYADDC